MGSKINKKKFGEVFKGLILFILCISCFSLIQGNAYAECPSQSVRVAISDTNFKSLVYSEISIVSTAEFAAYGKQSAKQLIKFQPTDIVKVKMESGKLSLLVNNKIVVKEITEGIVFDSPYGLLGIENLKRKGKQALYHGVLEIIPKNETQFYLVNVLDLQEYLKGVVPNEMPVRFGLEALKAQAVAARNYVLMPRTRAHSEFDVDDSVASQVYFGANTEDDLATRAIKETQGIVALHNWDLILAQYCSTAGGYTEDYENAFSDNKTKLFPAKPKSYLKGRPDMLTVGPLNREEEARIFYMSCPDSYDVKSPYYRWKKEFERVELEEVLKKTLPAQSATGFVKPEFKKDDDFGALKEIKVNRRGVSGKIMELEIITDKGSWKVSKELVIRRLIQKNGISLPSANAVFENLYDTSKNLNKIIIYGGGFGHGVGMSQFGAGFMGSSLHKSFDKILKRYYSGISLATVPVILSQEDGQDVVLTEFFAPYKKAVIVVDNKYQIKEFNANINNEILTFDLNPSLVGNRFSKIDISKYIKQGKNKVIFYFPKGEKNKGIRIYIELVEKDECEYSF